MNKLSNLSLIGEEGEKRVRMAPLAILGSHSVNGVAELHSKLVKEKLVPDFFEMFPERFNNKTNGITQRRWLLKSNKDLSNLITEGIGAGWIKNLNELKKLEKFKDDSSFLQNLSDVKHTNKVVFADYCKKEWGYKLDPDSIFDVQVKRIHEYKRQLLNVLHIISLYNRVRGGEIIHPRTFIFSGKAAPGYEAAKLIIKLINNISKVINGDKSIKNQIKVYFLPNYSVSLAEKIFPAAEISEQISTAGTEASGTGNMKFMLNGSLTVGTLDGANIEILEEAGKDNMFIFGLKTEEVEAMRHGYNPASYLNDSHIGEIIQLLRSGYFNISEPDIFDSLINNLVEYDYYMHFADLGSYIEVQKTVGEKYINREAWMKSSLMNIANSGKFSSDRTIAQYAEEIWDIKACHVKK